MPDVNIEVTIPELRAIFKPKFKVSSALWEILVLVLMQTLLATYEQAQAIKTPHIYAILNWILINLTKKNMHGSSLKTVKHCWEKLKTWIHIFQPVI